MTINKSSLAHSRLVQCKNAGFALTRCFAFVVERCSETPDAAFQTISATVSGSWDCVQSGSWIGGTDVDPTELAFHETVCTLTCDPGYAYKDAAETEIACYAEAAVGSNPGFDEWRVNGVAIGSAIGPSCETGKFYVFHLNFAHMRFPLTICSHATQAKYVFDASKYALEKCMFWRL